MGADQRTFVIVGASLAGAKAAETLRAEGFTGRIVLVGAEAERPYERPPLSKGYLLGNDPRTKVYVHEENWYAEHEVELLLDRRVTALDVVAHTVTLAGGDTLAYDKLLLATGSQVRRLSVPGCEFEGIRYLRTLDDADALREDMRAGGPVVVVGGGWIGLETAAAARSYGCDVTVVEVDSLPLRRVLGDEVAAVFRDLHVANGVEFRFGVDVHYFGSLADDRVSSVVLDDYTELPADLVIVGVGIRPAVELAAAAGLAVDDGIVTDAGLRTSDPDVYACGDVASSFHPGLDRHLRVEHWANAGNGGASAARSMLGLEEAYDPVPYFFSDQYDLGMEYSGWVEPGEYDVVLFRGDLAIVDGKAPEFIAFWLDDEGRVLAGMNVNVWDVQDSIQALVRAGWEGTAVDLADLINPLVPLGDLLS